MKGKKRGPYRVQPRVAVAIRLEPGQVERIDMEAALRQRSRAFVASEIIKEWFANKDKKEVASGSAGTSAKSDR